MEQIFMRDPKSPTSSQQKSFTFESLQKASSRINVKYHNSNKYQTVKQCLKSLDIFNSLMDQNSEDTQKLIRDVRKYMQINIYQQDQVVYSINDIPESFYLILKGSVSAYTAKQVQNEKKEKQFEWKEVDRYYFQQGFGDAEFISGKPRSFTIFSRQQTVLGVVNHTEFKEIIEKYKFRVYFKKREYYVQCPLFYGLKDSSLQVIVSNSKPREYKLGQTIFKQGLAARNIYYIVEGQIQLFKKNNQIKATNTNAMAQLRRYESRYKMLKIPVTHRQRNISPIKKIFISKVSAGSFLGDSQFVLNKRFQYTAKCVSQKVKVYYINKSIIQNILAPQQLSQVQQFYNQKDNFHNEKVASQLLIKKSIDQNLKQYFASVPPQSLSMKQMQQKRIILKRHVQSIPTSIGLMSPAQIQKYVHRKQEMIKNRKESSVNLPSIKLKTEINQINSGFNKNISLLLLRKKVLAQGQNGPISNQVQSSVNYLSSFRPLLNKNRLQIKRKLNNDNSYRQRIKTQPQTERSLIIQQSQAKIKYYINLESKMFGQ